MLKRKRITVLVILIINFLMPACTAQNQKDTDVTEKFLLKNNFHIGNCEYQGFDRATGERKVIWFSKPAKVSARLLLHFSDSEVFGDAGKTYHRFVYSNSPKIFIQTWDWEFFVNGDFGSSRAVNIQYHRIPEKLLKKIYGLAPFPNKKSFPPKE